MIGMMICSFLVSVKSFSNNFSIGEYQNIFITSHLNDHRELDSESVGHSHTHRHSEDEEEHTHKHFNIVTFSEMIFLQNGSLLILAFDFFHSIPKVYNHLLSTLFTLEILRPPIYS